MVTYPTIKDKVWFSIKGNKYLKRAIEISLTGQHTITVIGNVDNGEEYIETIYKSRDIQDGIFNENLLTFVEPCLCGNNVYNFELVEEFVTTMRRVNR